VHIWSDKRTDIFLVMLCLNKTVKYARNRPVFYDCRFLVGREWVSVTRMIWETCSQRRRELVRGYRAIHDKATSTMPPHICTCPRACSKATEPFSTSWSLPIPSYRIYPPHTQKNRTITSSLTFITISSSLRWFSPIFVKLGSMLNILELTYKVE
jgi:hypothetical protein